MKNKNFGISATLLCVAAYLLGWVSLWTVLAFTLFVFAFDFDMRVKKTAIQATVISIAFSVLALVLSILSQFATSTSAYNLFTNYMWTDLNFYSKIMTIFTFIIHTAEMLAYLILIICAFIKTDLFVPAIVASVDPLIQQQLHQKQAMRQQAMQQQAMQQAMQQQAMQQQAMQQQAMQQQAMQQQAMQQQAMQQQAMQQQEMEQQAMSQRPEQSSEITEDNE